MLGMPPAYRMLPDYITGHTQKKFLQIFINPLLPSSRQTDKVTDRMQLKDVRAQNVPTYRFFFNLPRRKVMIYFCQKGKKIGGHRARFRDHEVHF